MIDISKLDEYCKNLFEEIVHRHPEWLELAENDEPDYPFGFTIKIISPVKDVAPIEICSGGDPEGPGIGFGFSFLESYDMPPLTKPAMFYPNIDEVADAKDDVVKKIIAEGLISAEWKIRKKRFFPSYWNKGIITIEKYEQLKDICEFIRSVSWRGTYKLNYDANLKN